MNNKSKESREDAKRIEPAPRVSQKNESAASKKKYGTPTIEFLGSVQKITRYG